MVKGKVNGQSRVHGLVFDGEGLEEQAGRLDASELADRQGRHVQVDVPGSRAAVAVGREGGGGRAPFLAAGRPRAAGRFPNFSATLTIMNNDLQAVIDGS
jgi:hypothetical protein